MAEGVHHRCASEARKHRQPLGPSNVTDTEHNLGACTPSETTGQVSESGSEACSETDFHKKAQGERAATDA